MGFYRIFTNLCLVSMALIIASKSNLLPTVTITWPEEQEEPITYEEEVMEIEADPMLLELDDEAFLVEEEPEVIAEEPETVSPTRYEDLAPLISENDKKLLALVIYHEARGEPVAGQVAVCEVVLNRVLSDVYPDNVSEVVYQKEPLQFSCSPYLTSADINEPEALEQARVIVDEVFTTDTYQTPAAYLYFSTKQPTKSDYIKIGNHYFY